jgi:hypothetical protein
MAAIVAPTVDRLTDIRFVGSLDGCYTLSSRRERAAAEKDATVDVFACRAISISPMAMTLTVPVAGTVGESLTTFFEGLGILRGRISRLFPDGFVFDIEASDQERTALANRILWLKRQHVREEENKREYKRIIPRDPRSTLALSDGRILKCQLINISRSGAALSADVTPRAGDVVVVGRVIGKVVRRLSVGFAVAFDQVQAKDEFERLLTGYELAAPAAQATPQG